MICPSFVDHLVFRVARLDRTEQFYTALLGQAPDKTENSIMYRVGDSRLFFTLCVQPDKGYDKESIGLNHIAFGVRTLDDLQAIKGQLDSSGIVHSGIGLDRYGLKEYIWLDDPDGMRVEFYLRSQVFDTQLRTERLVLRPATVDLAKADLEDPSRFAELLEAEIPTSWPPELYDDHARNWTLRFLQNDPEGLITYYVLLQRDGEEPLLIGDAGFKGRPKNNVAEIGYSLVPEWRGRGLGTEAVRALMSYAFQDLNADMVCAHTLAELIPSQRVLEKNGFVLRGTPAEKDAIRYEITRAEWNSGARS